MDRVPPVVGFNSCMNEVPLISTCSVNPSSDLRTGPDSSMTTTKFREVMYA
jgi:hypothetical protein